MNGRNWASAAESELGNFVMDATGMQDYEDQHHVRNSEFRCVQVGVIYFNIYS